MFLPCQGRMSISRHRALLLRPPPSLLRYALDEARRLRRRAAVRAESEVRHGDPRGTGRRTAAVEAWGFYHTPSNEGYRGKTSIILVPLLYRYEIRLNPVQPQNN